MILSQSQEEHQDTTIWVDLREVLLKEAEQAGRGLDEISMMLEQSQVEVNKLTQRNAVVTARLQQVHAQFDSLPRADIRSAYDAALEAQQRLFVMRGQIEKLQSSRDQLEKYKTTIDRILKVFATLPQPASDDKSYTSSVHTFEMLVQAQEAERQRLARQMHDEPAQALSNFILQTEIAMRLFDIDPVKAKEELANLKAAAASTFQKVRDFIFQLRPMMLDDLGLNPTLSRYIESFKDQGGPDIRLSVTGLEQRLEPHLEVMIFRAIQELIGNALRHSQASLIKVQIDSTETEVRISVDDNGKGFDVEQALTKGMGLKLIRDRVDMLNGRLDVDSVIGQGTRVTFQIPAKKTRVFA